MIVWLLACAGEPVQPPPLGAPTEPVPTTPTPPFTTPPEPTTPPDVWVEVRFDGVALAADAPVDLGAAREGYETVSTSLEWVAHGADVKVPPDVLQADAAVRFDVAPPGVLYADTPVQVVLALEPVAAGAVVGALVFDDHQQPLVGDIGPTVPVVMAGPYGRYVGSFDYGATWPVDFQEEVDDGDGHSEGLVRGCGFGADVFVCVGGDTTGLYSVSTDGATWTRPVVGSRGWIADVAFGGDRFVAVGGFGNLAWSFDGLAWTETYRDYTTHLRAVAYGDGRFVAVGADRRAVTSDGVTWLADGVGFAPIERVAFGNGVFVGVGGGGAIAVTEDGVTWEESVLGGASRYGVAFGDGVFLVSGWPDGTYTSVDGRSWDWVSDESVEVRGFGAGAFYASAWQDRILRSLDGGATWDEVKGNSSPVQLGFNDFAFGVVP